MAPLQRLSGLGGVLGIGWEYVTGRLAVLARNRAPSSAMGRDDYTLLVFMPRQQGGAGPGGSDGYVWCEVARTDVGADKVWVRGGADRDEAAKTTTVPKTEARVSWSWTGEVLVATSATMSVWRHAAPHANTLAQETTRLPFIWAWSARAVGGGGGGGSDGDGVWGGTLSPDGASITAGSLSEPARLRVWWRTMDVGRGHGVGVRWVEQASLEHSGALVDFAWRPAPPGVRNALLTVNEGREVDASNDELGPLEAHVWVTVSPPSADGGVDEEAADSTAVEDPDEDDRIHSHTHAVAAYTDAEVPCRVGVPQVGV